jgi:hypothetical protein
VKKLHLNLTLSIALICLFALTIHAQDSSSVKHPKYYVLLFGAKGNGEAPRYSNFRSALETDIKKLIAKQGLVVLKNRKEAIDKGLNDCEILNCTYTINYATGLMLNAKLEGGLGFTDCNKLELYTTSAKRMAGAVAGEKSYMKLFSKMIKPGIAAHLGL